MHISRLCKRLGPVLTRRSKYPLLVVIVVVVVVVVLCFVLTGNNSGHRRKRFTDVGLPDVTRVPVHTPFYQDNAALPDR